MNEVLVKEFLNRKKTVICREFEKVCPTEQSLKVMVKEMHNIFDDLERELTQRGGMDGE